VFDSAVPIGATSEVGVENLSTIIFLIIIFQYLAGHYMIQSASSFLPVMALEPQPEEKVLDMCSAPGWQAWNYNISYQGH